jgi:hypothetical protein
VYLILFSGRDPALLGAIRCEEEAVPPRCFQEGEPFDRVCPPAANLTTLMADVNERVTVSTCTPT